MNRSLRYLLILLAVASIAQVPRPGPGQQRLKRVIIVEFPEAPSDWPQFNFDERHAGANEDETAINPGNVATLVRLFQSRLPAVSDGAPAYWSAGSPRRQDHFLFFTTTTGGLVAMSGDGRIRWQTTPPAGPRWTTSSPALDPSREYVYSYALDGRVHKYGIFTGAEVNDGRWPVLVTKKPEVEKGSSALSIATTAGGTSYLYATVAGYPEPGDAGDYQGHVVAIRLSDAQSVTFNVLCSYKASILGYGDCGSRQAGVWGRPGVIYNEADDSIYVATSNGPYTGNRGGSSWGNSILRLPPDLRVHRGKPLDAYTPDEYDKLDKQDLDLGSSDMALLTGRLGVHAGKDGVIRLINLADMSGHGAAGSTGGELQRLKLPQGGFHFSAPAVWTDGQEHTWVYFANTLGISAFELIDDAQGPHLVGRWTGGVASDSSLAVANGVIFCASNNRMSALDAKTGAELWVDTRIGEIHWASPIVVNGAVFMSDLDGTVTAWALPKQVTLR
jgi:PQQ-like domain